jgi:lipid II isoglutaminyl synthase (glutamine-hydrolysing)
MSAGDSALAIVHVYPTVLGLYGDRGNALVLAHRAAARGVRAAIVSIEPGEPIPRTADVYLLGGGEDLAQTTATELLAADGALAAAVARDAVVLAVCAGLQVLGTTFAAAGGQVEGLGLVDLATHPGQPRAVGELVADAVGLDLPVLTGYENHGGRTTLGPGVTPLGRVRSGVGNGGGDGTEGFVVGRVVGTYMHGPVLARNPALADQLLAWALGSALAPIDDAVIDALRDERMRANRGVESGHGSWLKVSQRSRSPV